MPFLRFTRWIRRRPALRWFRVTLLLLVWSLCLGWGLAQAKPSIAQTIAQSNAPDSQAIGTVDVIRPQFQVGQELYLQNCATCHLALPPAAMPTQTWQALIQDSQHYGVQIEPLRSPDLEIVWRYLSTFSRSTNRNEIIPYRIQQSRYFKALHPKVEFPQPPSVRTCATCHPAAAQFNYRSLAPEWVGE
ncbi:diheme cytochrome c [Leptolyngbya sp. GB1-A1]|uniref:cytochrome C n=1 Tax=Leptolyngbya sp. GB1-A1 TaxID=2933908 RepID=UPI0032974A55